MIIDRIKLFILPPLSSFMFPLRKFYFKVTFSFLFIYQIIHEKEKYIFQRLMKLRDLKKFLISIITLFLKGQFLQIIYI